MNKPTIEHNKVVCAPSIEPLKEWWTTPAGYPLPDEVPTTEIRLAIESHDALTAELSRLRSENEELRFKFTRTDVELSHKLNRIEDLEGHLKDRADALKEAKCALLSLEYYAHDSGNKKWQPALTAINSLNL